MSRREQVWQLTRQIPGGRVCTYGRLAEALGWTRGAREVGWAMATCPEDVPAHRVVNREGVLSGRHAFTGGPEEMERRLRAEGVEVVEDRVVDFERLLWDPGCAPPSANRKSTRRPSAEPGSSPGKSSRG